MIPFCLANGVRARTKVVKWILGRRLFGGVIAGQLLSLCMISLLWTSCAGADVRLKIAAFIESNCLDCHSGDAAERGLDFESLSFQLDGAENHLLWVKAFDRVRKGEMPPQDYDQPESSERDEFLEHLQSQLADADQQRQRELGRGVIRRLNRSEFETALSDLFQMPLNIQAELPEDAKSHGFDTVGEALNVSSVQMDAYLNVIDHVLDQATTLYARPKRRSHRLTYLENSNIMQVYRRGGPYLIQDDGVAFFATEKFSHLNAVINQWTAPHKGRYRVKVSAYALRSDEPVIVSLRAGGTGHAESNHVQHVFLDHFAVEEGEPQVFQWEGWLERGHYFHVYPTSLRAMRFAGKNEEMRQAEYQGPAAVIQWVEVDGPIHDQWPPASHQVLWGDTPTHLMPDAKPNRDPIAHLDEPPDRTAKPRMTRVPVQKATGNKWEYSPKQKAGGEPIYRAAGIPKPLHATLRLDPLDAKDDSARLLHSFAFTAFRRPVAASEIAPIVALTHRWLDEGRGFEAAMRIGYKALLTSPGFLYHQGTLSGASTELDQFAVAERLAFFLWNGLPDNKLRTLAETGQLSVAAVLRQQVERLLADRRSDRFLEQFLGQWLDLRLIDFTVPDEKLYPEFDKLLQWSMVEETHGFVRKLIDEDLPVRNAIDSDFAMVNWRLAKHYGLEPVEGMRVGPVHLPANSVRGGLMTQGSVLKVTANGTTTSPVVRGVWLMERIMGIEPDPPPPGIPAIEPDIRGATTVRAQLEKHRSVESCAGCHAKIDPPGVALESFDVIGGWRTNYRAINAELEDLKPKYSAFSPPPIRYIQGLPVDASYELSDGRSFENIKDFKRILLENERQIARGIVNKLVTYATGATISFADRMEVEAILDRAKSTQYGFRSLIHEIVQSPMFQNK